MDTPPIRSMGRSMLMMAAGAAGTMAGIIATGIMAAGAMVLRTAASAGMAAEATAKSPFGIFPSLHAREVCSHGLAGSDGAHKQHPRADAAGRVRGDGPAPTPRRSHRPSDRLRCVTILIAGHIYHCRTTRGVRRCACSSRSASPRSSRWTREARRDDARRLLPRPPGRTLPARRGERQLTTAVDWGRYAELFEYDASDRRLYLSEPVAGVGNESA